jgi:hypothetical protein
MSDSDEAEMSRLRKKRGFASSFEKPEDAAMLAQFVGKSYLNNIMGNHCPKKATLEHEKDKE